ncbi:S-adenosyl-L-methionine-dependent methyltransferase, partial [Lindgomyces ingoldianus]
LVDLSGGHGQISQALAKHTQNLTFTIRDLSHVVEQGRAALPSESKGQISFETQNFKKPQPSKKLPYAYLISRCLRNWSDCHSAVILRDLVPGLKTSSKVLVWDSVLVDRPVKKLSEKFNLQQDFIMATIQMARTDRWKSLDNLYS